VGKRTYRSVVFFTFERNIDEAFGECINQDFFDIELPLPVHFFDYNNTLLAMQSP